MASLARGQLLIGSAALSLGARQGRSQATTTAARTVCAPHRVERASCGASAEA